VGSPATAVIYSGDSGILNREIGVGITLSINVTGAQVFSGASNIFDSLIMLRDNLIAGNTAAISTGDINNLDRSIDNVLAYRAEIGAKINRLELHKERLGDMRVNFTKLLSANEDADMAEVIMNLQIQENVYRASLSTGARIIQPTLVDFLR
jgi:flagellar hook-associated protein 3 FlgL